MEVIIIVSVGLSLYPKADSRYATCTHGHRRAQSHTQSYISEAEKYHLYQGHSLLHPCSHTLTHRHVTSLLSNFLSRPRHCYKLFIFQTCVHARGWHDKNLGSHTHKVGAVYIWSVRTAPSPCLISLITHTKSHTCTHACISSTHINT